MKKKLTKIFAAVLSATLIMSCFSGCGKQVNDKDEQGRTVISVGEWPAEGNSELENMNKRKEMFEASNPDVVIEPSAWKFETQTFYAKAAGGQLPTVYRSYLTEASQIIDSGYAADLTDALKKRGYEGKFNEKLIDVVSDDNGRIYGFPIYAYIVGLAYNTELFEQAGLMNEDGTPMQPKDWNEVKDFAIKIKEKTGKAGFMIPTAKNAGGWLFTCLAWSFGTDFMEKDENGKWQATFNTPEAAEALQWVKDLKWKYDVLPSNSIVDLTEYYKTYGTGNAGMIMAAADVSGKCIQYGTDPELIGIMGLPAGPKRHVTLLGGSFHAVPVNATEDQIDAAIRWIETAYTDKVTDEFKTNNENTYKMRADIGERLGIVAMSAWDKETDAFKFMKGLAKEYNNANENYVRLYNEFVENCPADIQPEEPVCAQELYSILDSCLQEVLTNKDADCAFVLAKANADFQANYLDNLTY